METPYNQNDNSIDDTRTEDTIHVERDDNNQHVDVVFELNDDHGPSRRAYSTPCIFVMGIGIGVLFALSLTLPYQNRNNKAAKLSCSTVLSASNGTGKTTVTMLYEWIMSIQDETIDVADDADTMFKEEGFAEMPFGLVDFIKQVVAIDPGSDGNHRLNLPQDMIERMNGNCEFIEDFEPAKNTNHWQCDTSLEKPNFPLDGSTEGGYMPTDETFRLWAEATGESEEALRSIKIGSGNVDHKPGLWCSMPIPGDIDDPANQNVIDYWKTCVQPKAGYFNALQCKGHCTDPDDSDTCSTYAVLGFAALEGGVCYPTHSHMAEEGYWQIAGKGWWRSWLDVSKFQDRKFVSTNNKMGSKYAFHAHRQGVPHESDTTSTLDGDEGSGRSSDPMVMVYFWGLSNEIVNNYKFVPDAVQETPGIQVGAGSGSCWNDRRTPAYNPDQKVSINSNIC